MPDLDDFYAFQSTNSNSSTGTAKGGVGCGTLLIILAVIGWVLWFLGNFFG